ncbi:MAG: hypothetical protein AVDCRST_MAG26-4191, partial [uncultured Chloroflexia bacterium]
FRSRICRLPCQGAGKDHRHPNRGRVDPRRRRM